MFSFLGLCARDATKEFPYVFVIRSVRQGGHEGEDTANGPFLSLVLANIKISCFE